MTARSGSRGRLKACIAAIASAAMLAGCGGGDGGAGPAAFSVVASGDIAKCNGAPAAQSAAARTAALISRDDAIVLKSSSPMVTRNVTISNCIVSSECNAIKLGTESNGGFRNVVIGGCSIYNTRLAGLALEIVDGGILDGVAVSAS